MPYWSGGDRRDYKGESNFPRKLLDVRVKPLVNRLWYRGTLDEQIWAKCAAVVGSRRMSRYGKQVLVELVPRLVAKGYVIVSGLMYGVDQEAHRICLDVGGRAVGVLGYGINYQSELEARRMIAAITQAGGVVLSEYPGETVCQRWMFPQRNRIVVGLSDIIIIAEAGEKSGSLNTAKWAKQLGKEVYAVQGSMFSPTSAGANRLVAEGLAKALTPELLERMGEGGRTEGRAQAIPQLTRDEQTIVGTLKIVGPMGVNELTRKLGMPIGEIQAQLMALEIKGVVSVERGVWKVVL